VHLLKKEGVVSSNSKNVGGTLYGAHSAFKVEALPNFTHYAINSIIDFVNICLRYDIKGRHLGVLLKYSALSNEKVWL
jgi:hypothetical protein